MLRRYAVGLVVGLIVGWLLAGIVAIVGTAIATDRQDFTSRAALPILVGGVALGVLAARWAVHEPTPTNVKPFLIVIAITIVIAAMAARHASTLQQYCSYGATSDIQLAGCVTQVPRDYVESLDTNAARYAKGELGSCLADAGPYCSSKFFVFQWIGW